MLRPLPWILLFVAFTFPAYASRSPVETIRGYDKMLEQYDSLTSKIGFDKRVATGMLLKEYFSGQALEGQLLYLSSIRDLSSYDASLLFPEKIKREISVKVHPEEGGVCVVERVVEVYRNTWEDTTEVVLYRITLEKNVLSNKWKIVSLHRKLLVPEPRE